MKKITVFVVSLFLLGLLALGAFVPTISASADCDSLPQSATGDVWSRPQITLSLYTGEQINYTVTSNRAPDRYSIVIFGPNGLTEFIPDGARPPLSALTGTYTIPVGGTYRFVASKSVFYPGEVLSLALDAALCIANSPPTAEAGGPYGVDEGSSVTLDASGTTDTDQDANTLDYAWDFDGDGQHDDATGISPTFSAANLDGPTTVTIGLRITDAGGLTDTDTTTVTVHNVAPTITAVANDGPIIASESATVTVDASDPAGAADPLSYAFDCDGNGDYEVGPQAGNSASCLFTTAGSFTINVQVADDDGGTATGSTTVTVLTPQQAIANLQVDVQALVGGGSLNQGQGNALNSKLDTAIKKLDQGQPQAAVNNLNAFINQVGDFIAEGVLSEAEGQPLIDEANRVIAAIEAGS